MLKLHQFAPAFGLPNASSFCLKLETYLRMAEIPFESVYGMDMGKAPKGKMPYIVDGDKIIGDSNFIIDYLQQTYGDRCAAEIYAIGGADITALSDFLADQPFFFGSQPTTLDASAYGILTSILRTPLESPLKYQAQQLANLPAYCDRMRDRYYPA
jgi:glutathione S-transferase